MAGVEDNVIVYRVHNSTASLDNVYITIRTQIPQSTNYKIYVLFNVACILNDLPVDGSNISNISGS